MYLVKTPNILKNLYPSEFIWEQLSTDTVYLTFDDGPHPCATPFVLDELNKHHAKATFFCIGKNVLEQPDIYLRIKNEGHAIGNHTHTHPNGWKSDSIEYINNINKASEFIDSKLFRPPYGKIKKKQARLAIEQGYKIVMWDILCADFDTTISPEKCWENIAANIAPGSIIVFHDSSKAWERMKYALVHTLAYCRQKNWKMASLSHT